MAGYFKKLVGRVYDGSCVAAETLYNGDFVILNSAGKAVKPAGTDTGYTVKFVCDEKTELLGKKALVLRCIERTGAIYMVENDFPVAMRNAYDEANYSVASGKAVKMKMPLAGEQIVVSVADAVYNNAEVGNQYKVYGSGAIASDFGIVAQDYTVEADGEPHAPMASIVGCNGYTLYYKVGAGEWTTTAPTITEAGQLTVKLKATKTGFADLTHDDVHVVLSTGGSVPLG